MAPEDPSSGAVPVPRPDAVKPLWTRPESVPTPVTPSFWANAKNPPAKPVGGNASSVLHVTSLRERRRTADEDTLVTPLTISMPCPGPPGEVITSSACPGGVISPQKPLCAVYT
jgi:hypothetical protein